MEGVHQKLLITLILGHLLTYSWSSALLEEPSILQILKNLPVFYGTRKFITVFTKPSTAPYPEPDQSNPYHPTLPLRSILILFIHLRLGLPSGLFPSGFRTSILYAFLVSLIHATCPAHLILFDLIRFWIILFHNKVWFTSDS
jgi:hypothetical protein